MNRAVSYSIHMDIRNEGELQNSLNNVKKLLEKMWQENTGGMKCFLEKNMRHF